jgi:hypothetical protein
MPKMSDALPTTLSGKLVSVRRYATVHGGGTGSHVSVWTKERYEVWVRQDSGAEAQIRIRSKLFPTRTGHHVTQLVDGPADRVHPQSRMGGPVSRYRRIASPL